SAPKTWLATASPWAIAGSARSISANSPPMRKPCSPRNWSARQSSMTSNPSLHNPALSLAHTPWPHPRVLSIEHVCGLDLGQVHDPPALAVLETSEISIGRSLVTYDWITIKRRSFRHLERLPLGLDYPTIVEHVRRLVSRPELSHRKTLVVD